MLLADTQNIREVIMFPMNQRAEDLLMGAPSEPTNDQLRDLKLRVLPKKVDVSGHRPRLSPLPRPRGRDGGDGGAGGAGGADRPFPPVSNLRPQRASRSGWPARWQGREVPNLPQALGPRLAVARAMLGAMTPAEFEGAEDRIIRHHAGFAVLEQTASDFLHLYGLPNFFFHLTDYATLRAAGVPLGKADFDGFHSYPPDFRF